MSNITFIKGDTGWIVVDPLMSMECAAAAFSLVEENLGTFPVKAVIYSHSHIDHFGGVRGIISEEDVQSGDCLLYTSQSQSQFNLNKVCFFHPCKIFFVQQTVRSVSYTHLDVYKRQH